MKMARANAPPRSWSERSPTLSRPLNQKTIFLTKQATRVIAKTMSFNVLFRHFEEVEKRYFLYNFYALSFQLRILVRTTTMTV